MNLRPICPDCGAAMEPLPGDLTRYLCPQAEAVPARRLFRPPKGHALRLWKAEELTEWRRHDFAIETERR